MTTNAGTKTRKRVILFVVVSCCLVLPLLIAGWINTDVAYTFRELLTKDIDPFQTGAYFYELGTNVTMNYLPLHPHGFKMTFPPYYVNIHKYDLSNFTFITGSSSNHFKESKDLIASIQKVFPHKKIYYYDLGLNNGQIKQMESWCNVVYRNFNLKPYPGHVQNLHSYAFKPLIIYEAIQEFDAILWVDASGRLSPKMNHYNWTSVYEKARQTNGIVQFDRTGRDIFQCTTWGMYRYIPTDEEKLKKYEMIGATVVLLYRTEIVFHKIIHWWRLCALTKLCIQPKGHRRSCGTSVRPGVSICHRYDQSALDILVANMLNYNETTLPKGKPIIEVHRYPTNFYKLMTGCAQMRD